MTRAPFTPSELVDDSLPVVLVIADGLGDRACDDLDGHTPAEAARTPVLDELARRGRCGVHQPFGPGRATSSERAHWAMFGMSDVAFPGRAALELAGVGAEVPRGTPMWHLALRRGERRGDVTWIVGRGSDVNEAARAEEALLSGALGREYEGIRFRLIPLRVAEWVLIADGAVSAEVSDTDPLFEHLHPWMEPVALAESSGGDNRRAGEAQRSARALRDFCLAAHADLSAADIAHNVPATKWASWVPLAGVPTFSEVVGITGSMVPTSALYRGLARILDMQSVPNPGGSMASAIDAARTALDVDALDINALNGAAPPAFIHLHTKATDEAGHTKDPRHKVEVIEALDAELAGLLDLADHAVVAVTGDHATPSVTSLLHSGDPTPLVVVGPDTRADRVTQFGEETCAEGALARMAAHELLPMLLGEARRPAFLGHRAGARWTAAQPIAPSPMPAPHLVRLTSTH